MPAWVERFHNGHSVDVVVMLMNQDEKGLLSIHVDRWDPRST